MTQTFHYRSLLGQGAVCIYVNCSRIPRLIPPTLQGKTRVLTSRVVHLVQHHHIAPANICAVTFTNKAANEMKERLRKMIGHDLTERLVMGGSHLIFDSGLHSRCLLS